MKYGQLSEEAKDVLKGMVEFCINHGYCMGMDQGIAKFADDAKDEELHPFRDELEKFCEYERS